MSIIRPGSDSEYLMVCTGADYEDDTGHVAVLASVAPDDDFFPRSQATLDFGRGVPSLILKIGGRYRVSFMEVADASE